jgi:hypothetical protein
MAMREEAIAGSTYKGMMKGGIRHRRTAGITVGELKAVAAVDADSAGLDVRDIISWH